MESRNQIYDFVFNYAGGARWQEAPYRGPGAEQIRENWNKTKEAFLQRKGYVGPSALEMSGIFHAFEAKDAAIVSRLTSIQASGAQVWRTRAGTYRKKPLPDVRDVKMDQDR